jgi:hypothetical protein
MSVAAYKARRQARLDADEDGHWVTTEDGNHMHISGEGDPDKGNPYVLAAADKGIMRAIKSADSPVEFWMNLNDDQQKRVGKNYKDIYSRLKSAAGEKSEWAEARGSKSDMPTALRKPDSPVQVRIKNYEGKSKTADADEDGVITLNAAQADTWSDHVFFHEIGHQISALGLLERVAENPGGLWGRYNQRRGVFESAIEGRFEKNPDECFSDMYADYRERPNWLQDKAPDVYKYFTKLENDNPWLRGWVDRSFKEYQDAVSEYTKETDVHADADEPTAWITVNGTHIPINEKGEMQGAVAEKIERGSSGKVSVKGVSAGRRKAVDSALTKSMNKFPKLKGIIKGVEVKGADFVGFQKHPDAKALYSQADGKIYLNSDLYGEGAGKDPMQEIKAGVENGRYPAGATEEHVIAHEAGHALGNYLHDKVFDKVGPLGEEFEESLYKKAESAGLLNGGVGKNLSGYAESNKKEFVAEALAEYICSDSPRPLAKFVGKEVAGMLEDGAEVSGVKQQTLSKELQPKADYDYSSRDYQEWMHNNKDVLLPMYKADRDIDLEGEFYKGMLSQSTKDLNEISRDKADEILYDNLYDGAVQGWFRGENREYKPRIFSDICSNPETRNAALNVMYDNYKYAVKFLGAKDMPFDEFLTTPITMYRGGQGKNIGKDVFSSYTFDKKVAEKFSGKGERVYGGKVRPIDTLGSVFHNGEAEIMVPSWLAPSENVDHVDSLDADRAIHLYEQIKKRHEGRKSVKEYRQRRDERRSVRLDFVGRSADLSNAKWVTVNGNHIAINEEGMIVAGNPKSFGEAAKHMERERAKMEAGRAAVKPLKPTVPGVAGKDISKSYRFDPEKSKHKFAIEDVVEKQGFDALPKVVSPEEFKKAAHESGMIFKRSYGANDPETLEAYRDSLYSGKFYVTANKGAKYGQGMYCQLYGEDGDTPQNDENIRGWAKKRGKEYSVVETFTLPKDAKIIDYESLRREWEGVYDRDKFSRIRKERGLQAARVEVSDPVLGRAGELHKKFQNIGAWAAALGYDAVKTSYYDCCIILNRGKCIFKEPEEKKNG